MKIYHNPRCSKSRQTLAIIQESGVEPEIVEYLEEPPSAQELDRILTLLDKSPQDVMRNGEAIYKELRLADQTLSRVEAIQILVENPKLIERPIVVEGDRAVIGRPPENVRELLGG